MIWLFRILFSSRLLDFAITARCRLWHICCKLLNSPTKILAIYFISFIILHWSQLHLGARNWGDLRIFIITSKRDVFLNIFYLYSRQFLQLQRERRFVRKIFLNLDSARDDDGRFWVQIIFWDNLVNCSDSLIL